MNTSDAYARFMKRLDATPQATFHLGLEAMQRAVQDEGLSHPAAYVVIVAGTNGKGTVAASLSHLCTERGLRTTLLTSPHLVEFRERIRIDGQPIAASALAALGDRLLPAYGAESGREPRPLSYFELSILFGLAAAREAQSDVLIMEVGLGGRLDATNVVDSDLAVITSISLDHTDLLGTTLPEIVAEKAAVARRERPVIHHAHQGGKNELKIALAGIGARSTMIDQGAGAREQNLALAAAAFERVQAHFGMSASPTWTAETLDDFQWPGRLSWEQDRNQRPVLVDGAHNAESAAELARYLETLGTGQRFEAVVALSAGRKIEEVLAPLAPYVSHWHVCAPDFARANPAADTASSLRAFEEAQARAGLPSRPVDAYPSVDAALQAMERRTAERGTAESPAQSLVFGSLYLVGDAYRYWGYGDDRLPSFSKKAARGERARGSQLDASSRAERLGVSAEAPATGVPGFLNGPWFPDGREERAIAEQSQSRLPLIMPRTAAALTAFMGMLVMLLVHIAVGGRLSMYAGLAVGTLAGNLLVGFAAVKYLRIPMPTLHVRVRAILAAVAMGAVFSLTGALMTGALTEAYSFILEGTSLGQVWSNFLSSREAGYEAILSPETPLALLAAFTTIAILPGICEEYLFRGVLYRLLDGVKTWRKVAFIGILFGAIHVDPAGFIPLCILGGALTWLRVLTGSWVMPAFVHIAFNGTALMMAMSPALSSLDEGEGSLPAELAVLAVTCALSVYLFRRFGRAHIASAQGVAG